jgi:hypothetical protein
MYVRVYVKQSKVQSKAKQGLMSESSRWGAFRAQGDNRPSLHACGFAHFGPFCLTRKGNEAMGMCQQSLPEALRASVAVHSDSTASCGSCSAIKSEEPQEWGAVRFLQWVDTLGASRVRSCSVPAAPSSPPPISQSGKPRIAIPDSIGKNSTHASVTLEEADEDIKLSGSSTLLCIQ